MLLLKKCRNLLAGLLLLFIGGSCHNYYKAMPGQTGQYAGNTIDSLLQNRHFILRNGTQALYMKNIVVSADRQSITCTLDTLPPEHQLHLRGGHKGNLQYRKMNINETSVLSEVHLYTVGNNNVTVGENYSFLLDKVQKIEVIEKDNKRTTNSYVLGAIGYTAGAFVLAAIIIAATKSSCPFVSAYDGKEFALQGEIYGGAIYPQLARHDYLPLKMAPLTDGTLQLKITNELKERQYTDFADLLVITHVAGARLLADESGKPYSIASPQAPLTATLNGRKDVLPGLLHESDNTIVYMDDTTTKDATNNVVMKFKNEATASKAKLVLTLKNAYWLDLLYGELAKGFGSYYEKYLKKQSKKPVQQLQKWITEQQLPLSVSLRTKEGWKKVTDVTTIGPLANRSIIVPVDVSQMDTDDIEISLSSGFMFWEIDYAGLDFSADQNFTIEKLAPAMATDETGKDVLPALQKEDGIYLEQPYIGNAATISYKSLAVADPSKTQSFFLHTKGWYQHIRNFTNGPNAAFLKQFLKPNAFSIYGKQLYKQIQTESLRFMAAR